MDPADRPAGCRCPCRCTVPVIAATKDLEDQEWYHGFRPLADLTHLIRQPGEFAVSATTTAGLDTTYVITVMMRNETHVHLALSKDEQGWFIAPSEHCKTLDRQAFPSIYDLVDYYRREPISYQLIFAKVIRRPAWMVKHDDVAFEETKDRIGPSGRFFKGTWKRENKKTITVAIKRMDASGAIDEDKEKANTLMHEMMILPLLSHDNVIQFHGISYDHQPIMLLTEFCPGSDLLSHLAKYGKETDVREKAIYLYEAARALFYLHHAKCVVRNVCARNCLISSAGRIKIANLGNVKIVLRDSDDDGGLAPDAALASYAMAHARYCAPETLSTPPVFSRQSDVWSFGALVYEVFSNGVRPWPDDIADDNVVAAKIRKGELPTLPEGTPPQLAELVCHLWKMSPDQRPVMRLVALELNHTVKDLNSGHELMPHEQMIVNKIPGVEREIYFEYDETSEFEPSSGPSTDQEDREREQSATGK